MKKIFTYAFILLTTTLLFSGCAGMKADNQPLQFSPQKFESGKYESKIDNFQIILDASMTMGDYGNKNFASAKNFVTSVNQSLPADLDVNGGLRTFGHDDRQSKMLTDLAYGMAKYSQSGLQTGIDSVKYVGGNSPLYAALDAATADLKNAGGKSAIVVVSDGLQMESAPVAAANLKNELGDNVCIYTVWIGDNPAGQMLLEKVAKAGGCGSAYNGGALTNADSLGAFVEQVFLAQKAVAKPAPKPAPAPAPAPVVMAKEVVTFNLLFGFDKAVITDEMIPILEQAKIILNEDKTARFTVSGHTCSMGPESYNQGLSERRAAAVRNWLVANGVAASRLDVNGYGEARPKFDNAIKEGRRLNRRVELESK